MSLPPTVTVIVPHGGTAARLATTLSALGEQRYPASRFEVLVVRCPAAELRRGFSPRPRGSLGPSVVELVCDTPGFAPASARNVGLRSAGGDVIVSLDDDVVAPPDLLSSHVRRHGRGHTVATFGLRRFTALPNGRAVLAGAYRRLKTAPDVLRSASNRPGHRRDWRLEQARRLAQHPHPYHLFHGCNVSYTRTLALEVGGWCADFDGGYGFEDVEFGARLQAAGARIEWVPEAEVLHLEDPRAAPARQRAGRDRNLDLVQRTIPGYGAFRREEALIASPASR